MLEERNVAVDNNTSEIPKYVYESLARCLLPAIQEFYESDDGKKEYEEWKAKQSESENNEVK